MFPCSPILDYNIWYLKVHFYPYSVSVFACNSSLHILLDHVICSYPNFKNSSVSKFSLVMSLRLHWCGNVMVIATGVFLFQHLNNWHQVHEKSLVERRHISVYDDNFACIAVHCPAGTYAGEKQQQCTHCPRGFYQTRDRQGSCIRCPMGTYTREEGKEYYKILA